MHANLRRTKWSQVHFLFPASRNIVQRGNVRQACFADDGDYLLYRQESALKHACTIHAYELMINHVHLLVTSLQSGASLQMMQAIVRRCVGCFNAGYRRTGTLYKTRFKSALVDSERYILACYRSVERDEYPGALHHRRAGRDVSPQVADRALAAARGPRERR